jgi:hypothetical protein
MNTLDGMGTCRRHSMCSLGERFKPMASALATLATLT